MVSVPFGFTAIVQPTRRTLTIVALGFPLALLPVLVSPSFWVAWIGVWALFLMALVVEMAMLPARRDFDVRLDAPHRAGIASALEVRVLISRLPGARPLQIEVALDLSGFTQRLLPVSIMCSESASARLRIVPTRRGIIEFETIWLRSRGPLGLLEKAHSYAIANAIAVVPDLGAAERQAATFSSRGLRAQIRVERFHDAGSEFDALREFTPGFDPRNIDWKSSARHTTLLSRHFRAERDREVVIAIDSGRLMSESIDGLPRLDHAIHAGLLLALTSIRAGDRVGFYSFDARPQRFVEPRAGGKALETIVSLSALIPYCELETNFTFGLTHLLERIHRRSLVIVMTDFADAITAELMLENLVRLASRHLVVFVSLADPLLRDLTARPPSDLDSLGRAVVAESLLRERETVLRTLERRGVSCIDASPADVNMKLLNRYLEVKHRELVG